MYVLFSIADFILLPITCILVIVMWMSNTVIVSCLSSLNTADFQNTVKWQKLFCSMDHCQSWNVTLLSIDKHLLDGTLML